MDIEKNKTETPNQQMAAGRAAPVLLLRESWIAAPRFTGRRSRP